MDVQLQAWDEIKREFRHGSLLLGNGGSRAIWEGFAYASLFEEAQSLVQHPLKEADMRLFSSLSTTNFEAVLSALRTAEMVDEILDLEADIIRVRHDSIRIALMEAVRSIHVPWLRVPRAVLLQLRNELTRHSYVFTTNYDLLVYWALMCEEDPAPFKDYFWTPCADAEGWTCFDPADVEISGRATRVLYLHGALHLVELPWGQTAKATVTSDGGNLLDRFAICRRRVKTDPQTALEN